MLKRTISHHLLAWKNRSNRKPLLLRGARQVGKTHAVRMLGATFTHFVEINLESNAGARAILEKDLDIERIVLQLSELLQKDIVPGKTLLFFDEIQNTPKAILSLRYFYETMPTLHVIAAGSLLDFAIEEVGIPVGRVTTLYMYPLSFFEFLVALEHKTWAKKIILASAEDAIEEQLHEKLLHLVGIYVAIGGMPEAVNEWIKNKTSRSVKRIHADLIYSYEQDFGKYAKKNQEKYLYLLFLKAINQLSNKFMYSRVGEYQKRELAPALALLEKAGLFYKITRSAGQGIPIGSQADLEDFKIIFLDVGLSQALLKLDITPWFINPLETFINKGEIIEAFVGQELLAYADPITKESLFYWTKAGQRSQAEVDFLIQIKDAVIPVEVKAGVNLRIKSMYIFFESHIKTPYGIRFWAGSYATEKMVHSYPLYAVAKPLIDANEELKEALLSIIK